MRAHQKDAYFESSFRTKIQDVLHVLKGQRFVHTHPEEITVAAKSLYLILTTLLGARTLGEEYVDLMYVNRSRQRFPPLVSKIGFIFSYALLPYIISRVVKRWRANHDEGEEGYATKILSSYTKVLDVLMNLHIAVFYFLGQYYSLSKRIFGLRYVFGHNKDPRKLKQATGSYGLLGAVILLQFAVKGLLNLKTHMDKRNHKNEDLDEPNSETVIRNIGQLESLGEAINKNETLYKSLIIDLADPLQLPYIPENSRACMLCLSPMTNPAAANCGHFFCWVCIVDWIRDHPECPLCRQHCEEQNLLPLR